MNQPVFLQLVERLEGFLGKLPASIQKPVLHELTPLKELFLKQRAPRLVLTGAHKLPLQEVVGALFAAGPPEELRNVLMEVNRWHATDIGGHGSIALLDARGADAGALRKIEEELAREAPDAFLHVIDGSSARPVLAREIEALATLVGLPRADAGRAKVIGVSLRAPKRASAEHNGHAATTRGDAQAKLQTALEENPRLREHLLAVIEIDLPPVPA